MSKLATNIKKALELNAEVLTIEYKDGYEEIAAYCGSTGVVIDAIKSNSEESESLFSDLRNIERTSKLMIGTKEVLLGVTSYDSFGETAYDIRILRKPPDAAK